MLPRPWAVTPGSLPALWPVLLGTSAAIVAGCASPGATSHVAGAPSGVEKIQHVDVASAGASGATLAGARCSSTACTCRAPGDDAESQPPAEGMKRLEIRLSADGGSAVLDSPTLGRFTAVGARELCYYVDVVAGTKHGFSFTSEAASADLGLSPRLAIAEYGPQGHHWYKVHAVECVGSGGRCDRAGAEAWVGSLQTRKRGRLDPCGSLVVTGLDWETSGGQARRDGGLFRDFSVTFEVEVKKFAPRFAPGSTECVPK